MAEIFRSKMDLFEVEVNFVTKDSYQAVSVWCEGMPVIEHDALDNDVTYPGINVPVGPEEIKRAQEDDVVVKFPNGQFDVMNKRQFHALYESI